MATRIQAVVGLSHGIDRLFGMLVPGGRGKDLTLAGMAKHQITFRDLPGGFHSQ
jgi:hypothetical protein